MPSVRDGTLVNAVLPGEGLPQSEEAKTRFEGQENREKKQGNHLGAGRDSGQTRCPRTVPALARKPPRGIQQGNASADARAAQG